LTEKLAKSADKVIYAQAERIERGPDGRPVAVIAKDKDGQDIRVGCSDVLVAAGPWAGRLAKKLFKDDSNIDTSDYNIVGSRAHSVRYDALPIYFYLSI
jgi:glycine/D-amino acid oxidase-like deaminating enzyme